MDNLLNNDEANTLNLEILPYSSLRITGILGFVISTQKKIRLKQKLYK